MPFGIRFEIFPKKRDYLVGRRARGFELEEHLQRRFSARVASAHLQPRAVELAPERDHFDRRECTVPAFVSRLGARTLDRLFDGVRSENAERDGNAGLYRNLGDPLGDLARHMIEVWSRATNDRTGGDD